MLSPYSQGAQEINFKLYLFETLQSLIGQWTNSNNHRTVTDGLSAVQICRGCMVDYEKKNPYWVIWSTEKIKIMRKVIIKIFFKCFFLIKGGG